VPLHTRCTASHSVHSSTWCVFSKAVQCVFWACVNTPVPPQRGHALSSAARTALRMKAERLGTRANSCASPSSALNVMTSSLDIYALSLFARPSANNSCLEYYTVLPRMSRENLLQGESSATSHGCHVRITSDGMLHMVIRPARAGCRSVCCPRIRTAARRLLHNHQGFGNKNSRPSPLSKET